MPRGGRRGGGRRSQPSTPRTSRVAGGNPATPSSGRGSDGLFANGQWFCDCKPRRPAALRETRKPGANKGRWFYTCPQERRNQCTFFLWEDYAGVSSGAGSGAGGGHRGPPPSSQAPPRPTYRTSMGQRTTPPAERQDGPAQLTVAGQRALPPPPPSSSSTGRQRQRIFTTPTAAQAFPDNMAYEGYEDRGGNEEEEDEDDGFEPPPTPTPARSRPQNTLVADAGGTVPIPSTASPSTAPVTAVTVEEAPQPAEPPRNPITKYFGVVKRNGSAGETGDGGGSGKTSTAVDLQTPRKAKTTVSTAAGNNAFDYSDSEFDSDMERALVALADHSERKTRRHSDKERETDALVKKEEDDEEEEEEDDGINMAVDNDATTERRRRIIVPVREDDQQHGGQDYQEEETPSRRRNGRWLLVASGDYAAKEAAAEAAAKTATRTVSGGGTTSSFASLFGGNGDQTTSFVSSVPSSQPASRTASSQALTQSSVGTTATTTPPSSFRSDAGTRSGVNTASGTKRKHTVDPWYGTSTQGYNDDDDDDDNSDENDPFTSTPSKRVRFSQEPEEDSSPRPFVRGSVQYSLLGSSPTPTPGGKRFENSSAQRPHWAEDEGMHVDGDRDGDSRDTPVVPPSQSSQPSQPKDHNVTLAVLQLLDGQPVAPRVRQQIRALLNGAFEDEPDS